MKTQNSTKDDTLSRVLVTGVAGFIASRVAHQLLDAGVDVVGIDNLNDYYDPNLKNYRLEYLKKYPNFKFYKRDVEDYNSLYDLSYGQNFEVVYNLAARAGVRASMENPDIYLSTNSQGTLNILKVMQKLGIPKIVLASTSSLYAGQTMPFNEELAVNNPISPYAASKKSAELMCHAYHHLYKIDVSVVRYFTVFGPAGRPDMSIFRFIRWIHQEQPIELFGEGGQSRDFTFVEDIARGTIAASKNVGYEIFNLGGGNNPISLNTVISKIESSLNKKAILAKKPFHVADIESTWADISKAEKLLGWKPQVDFDEGLKQTIDWYLANMDLCLQIKL
jgi:UDP-glucuronate 4-epimerase